MIVRENITDFNLEHIFECGQCFRWEKEDDGSYTGIADGKRPVNIAFCPYSEQIEGGQSKSGQSCDDELNKLKSGLEKLHNMKCDSEKLYTEQSHIGKLNVGKQDAQSTNSLKSDKGKIFEGNPHVGKLLIDNADEADFEFWNAYLDLNRDYGEIKTKLSNKDKVMARAIEFGYGIRILRQDEWETLISFIISQNNNIGRIKKCITKLCENFGEFVEEYRGKKYYGIPNAKVLASLTEEDLAVCGLGYRAKYLIEVAKDIEKDNGKTLLKLRELDSKLAFSYLTSLHGVGPKVANCILLFGLDKFESFPIDVWVKEAMNKLYGLDKEDVRGMAEYAKKHFGEYGGIAQQYLFYYMRSM